MECCRPRNKYHEIGVTLQQIIIIKKLIKKIHNYAWIGNFSHQEIDVAGQEINIMTKGLI